MGALAQVYIRNLPVDLANGGRNAWITDASQRPPRTSSQPLVLCGLRIDSRKCGSVVGIRSKATVDQDHLFPERF